MYKTLSILLIMSLLSCETLVDDLPLSRFPELKSKLVMTSFISPQDSIIAVKLSQSVPLFGEFPKPKSEKMIGFNGDTVTYINYNNDFVVADAEVILTDGKKSITIPYSLKTREYSISSNDFKIEAGKTYSLSAKTKELFVEATTTVPAENITIENIKADSTFEKLNNWEDDGTGQFRPSEKLVKVINLEFDWKDVPKVNNYYKIEGFVEINYENALLEKNQIIYRTFPSKNFFNWGGRNYAPKKRYLTDENLDGKSIFSPIGKIFNFPLDSRSGSTINGKFYPTKEIGDRILYVKLMNVNKDFYQNQLVLETLGYGDGNPFVEPTQIYSNIKNGLGCFGAYNISVKTMKIPR